MINKTTAATISHIVSKLDLNGGVAVIASGQCRASDRASEIEAKIKQVLWSAQLGFLRASARFSGPDGATLYFVPDVAVENGIWLTAVLDRHMPDFAGILWLSSSQIQRIGPDGTRSLIANSLDAQSIVGALSAHLIGSEEVASLEFQPSGFFSYHAWQGFLRQRLARR